MDTLFSSGWPLQWSSPEAPEFRDVMARVHAAGFKVLVANPGGDSNGSWRSSPASRSEMRPERGILTPVLKGDHEMKQAKSPEAQRVESEIERVASGLVGRIGVAARAIDGNEVLTINGDEPFVMASTYKVAIAVTVLDRVDKGQLTLEQLVDVTLDMMVTGDNVIAMNFVHPGLKLSVANVIEAMITESDNTATDICMGLAGGPPEVTDKLRSIGITGQRVDRRVVEIIRDFYDLPGLATAKVGAEALKTPGFASRVPDRNLNYESDPRDQSTPKAMLELLLKIDDGRALSAKSREFLLGVMSRTRTGVSRFKGLLPRGTPVAHKTGTIGGVANDVGYITLPDGRRFAIAIFTKSSERPAADRDRAIAEATRTLYDYFNLLPATKRK